MGHLPGGKDADNGETTIRVHMAPNLTHCLRLITDESTHGGASLHCLLLCLWASRVWCEKAILRLQISRASGGRFISRAFPSRDRKTQKKRDLVPRLRKDPPRPPLKPAARATSPRGKGTPGRRRRRRRAGTPSPANPGDPSHQANTREGSGRRERQAPFADSGHVRWR